MKITKILYFSESYILVSGTHFASAASQPVRALARLEAMFTHATPPVRIDTRSLTLHHYSFKCEKDSLLTKLA